MPFAKSKDGTRIYYKISKGTKQNLVFLHGWPHNHTVWNKEIAFLAKRGYICLALDVRGHGKSDKPRRLKDYSFDRFSSDVIQVMHKSGMRRAVIVGHSFGGMMALSFYKKYKNAVRALVLLDTLYENPLKHIPFINHFNVTPLTEHLLKYIICHESVQQKFFPYVNFSKFKDHSDFYFWLKGVKETPMKSVLCCLEEMLEFNRRDVLSRIKVPTLIIEGERDSKTTLADVKKMSKKIRKSRLVIIENAGHDTNIRNPVQVEHAMLDFLKHL